MRANSISIQVGTWKKGFRHSLSEFHRCCCNKPSFPIVDSTGCQRHPCSSWQFCRLAKALQTPGQLEAPYRISHFCNTFGDAKYFIKASINNIQNSRMYIMLLLVVDWAELWNQLNTLVLGCLETNRMTSMHCHGSRSDLLNRRTLTEQPPTQNHLS